MAICRIKKIDNYTVLSNYFIDDSRLSLKGVGLLTRMLRLPDSWDFSIKGLAAICKEGPDGIAAILHELEDCHYITKERERAANGRVGRMVYTIYEVPYDVDISTIYKEKVVDANSRKQCGTKSSPVQEKPVQDTPEQEKPKRENPVQVKPYQGTPEQAVSDWAVPAFEKHGRVSPDVDMPVKESTAQINKELSNTKTNNYEINNYPSSSIEMDGEGYYALVKSNVDYEIAKTSLSKNEFEIFDELTDLIVEVLTIDSTKTGVKINGETYPYSLVKKKFLKLNFDSLLYVIECMKKSAPSVKNMRGYMLSALYNAGSTLNSYYQCEVWHDQNGPS